MSNLLAFRVGDKVASIAGHGKWVGTIVETHPGHKYGWVYRVRFDEAADYHFGSYGRYAEGELQYAPIPDKPKRKFRVGDKVRRSNGILDTIGTVVALRDSLPGDFIYDVKFPDQDGYSSVTPGAGTYREGSLVLVTPQGFVTSDQEFKLRVGDKIRNNLTGRKGVVERAPLGGGLKVYDLYPPYRDGVPVAAVEEYEFWHPGTYEHTHRAHKIGPF